MSEGNPLNQHLTGAGLVIGARARLDAFPVGSDVCFADSCDLAALRAAHPAWRSVPLAPVEFVDETGMLSGMADASLDFAIDWAMFRHADGAVSRLGAAARVLRSGGVLLLPVCDSRFVDIDAEAQDVFAGLDRLVARLRLGEDLSVLQRQERERWSFARFAAVIAVLATEYAPRFELEQVQRYGRYNLALLRRRRDVPIEGRSIVACGTHCYVVDGPFLRHVTSLNTLDRLQAFKVPKICVSVAERALFVAGPSLNQGDVADYLARTEARS